MIEVGDLVTWTIKESLEWADPPIGVVTAVFEEYQGHTWYTVKFTTGYRANQTFELKNKQVRRIKDGIE